MQILLNFLNLLTGKLGFTEKHIEFLTKNTNYLTDLKKSIEEKINQLVGGFLKTEVVVTLGPNNDDFHAEKDIPKILTKKADGGIFDYVDDDFINWLGETKTKKRTEPVVSRLFRFPENITNKNIIANGQSAGVYKKYCLRDAVEFAVELVKAGQIEERGKGVLILLEEEYNGSPCGLDVWRYGDGELKVCVDELNPGSEWNAGIGVLFSN